MPAQIRSQRLYEGDGDQLLVDHQLEERLVLLPDARPTDPPRQVHRCRILWGQHLVEDVLAGRYRSLVCAVNSHDNSRGIISQLARLLGTSQWDEHSITEYASRFAPRDRVTVLKFDMDAVEVLALLRPAQRDHLTMQDLSQGFGIVTEMVRRRTERLPIASVSFLGARANRLVGPDGEEPSFEAVLRTMHDAGFAGDVYPAPWMWTIAPTAVYARYPFPPSLDAMRAGGF